MPIAFLNDAERARLDNFPPSLGERELIAHFTISPADRKQIPRTSAPHNRLGFGLQLGALRLLGFCPSALAATPKAIVSYVASQLGVEAAGLEQYGRRGQTRTEHWQQIQRYLGFHRASVANLTKMKAWLTERALEHDRPTLLLELACERFRSSKIVRPGLTVLERVVSSARRQARRETYRRLAPLLTAERCVMLDGLVNVDPQSGRTPLAWLREEPTRNSPQSITAALDKLRFLQPHIVGVDLARLTPNHQKHLAQIAYRSAGRALAVMVEERRYPILLAFVLRAHDQATDEAIEMFERCLAATYARAERELDDARLSTATSTEEKMRMLHQLLELIVDRSIPDKNLRGRIFDKLPESTLNAALADCHKLLRPEDGGHFELLAGRYGYLRKFAPAFLAAFDFRSHQARDPLLAALDVLRELNALGHRAVPEDAPLSFVPAKWLPCVVDDEGHIERRYYELCVLWVLRGALRAGDVWLVRSRRYADPESYLIPSADWPTMRAEVCEQLGAPGSGTLRVDALGAELEALLLRVDGRLPRLGNVRMEDGTLIVPRLPANEPPDSLIELEKLVEARLPLVELSDLLMDVDGWTSFSQELRHAANAEPRSQDLLVHSHASILAQACNMGLSRMAHGADLSYERLSWCTTWYLREETLGAALSRVVNYHHHLPLSRIWGDAAFSSSDGQRFLVSVPSRTATAVRPYFGRGRGLTAATWTCDQFSQYAAKPIPAAEREATYVLDGILDNVTELPIVEHTTDTGGYTDIVFTLFDLLGLQFIPRLRDVGGHRLYRLNKNTKYRHLEPLLRGQINSARILDQWDAMLRVAGSLSGGWVTTSLFMSKLQRPKKNALATALQEYGRLVKTIFVLRYIEDDALQRRVGAQLNKTEAIHALRRFLVIANDGQIRCSGYDDQVNQVACMNLVSNAIVTWNTVYIQAVLKQLRAEGHPILDADIARLSPVRSGHINPYGRYTFDVRRARPGGRLRPLRRP